MENPFTGVRFLVIEETDLGSSVVEEYDAAAGEIEQMREYLEKHVQDLNHNHQDKHYCLKVDNEDRPDESQQILTDY